MVLFGQTFDALWDDVEAAKALLAGALGLTTADRRRRPGFLRFAGSISRKDAESMMAFVNDAEFSKVSAEDWK